MEYLFKCNVNFTFIQQNWIQLQIRGVFDATELEKSNFNWNRKKQIKLFLIYLYL